MLLEILYRIFLPLGIAGYVFLFFAVLTGLRVIKVKVKWHRLIAIIAIILASMHLALGIYLGYL